MSNTQEEQENNNLICSKINNGPNDEEIIINDKEETESYQYYESNKLFNNGNNINEGEADEDSDDTIVAYQEEKNSNLLESRDNIFSKDSTNENEINIEYEKEEKINALDNKLAKAESNDINNNKIKINNLNKIGIKKKKKKKKKNKEEKIEIFAQDKKLKQIKLNNLIKKIKIDKRTDKSLPKLSDRNDPNILKKKLSNPINLNQFREKGRSKSIKQTNNKILSNASAEFTPKEIIYENGVSDDEEEIKKILKKRKKRKTYLKPIMTPYLLSIKEKNEYNLRLQKIRQQFTEKKFVHEQKFFYYVLKPGNGASLVKNSLKHRINWKEAQMNVTSLFNFKWQSSNSCIDFNRLSSVESIPQMVNHFEFHSSISNKSNMFLNLFQYCESNNINIWKYVPLTIFISPDNENEKYFDNLFDSINNYIVNYKDIKTTIDKEKKYEKYSKLFKTMQCQIFGRRKDLPKDRWMMGSKTPLQIPDTHYEGKNLWVLKASNLNRGQCIRLLDSKEKFHEIIKDWSQGINLKNNNKGTTDNNIQFRLNCETSPTKTDEIPMSDTYITEKIVAQKYIEKPLCYYGRKCDMRVWVMLTHDLKVYVYKEGHLKTCSEKYDINNQKDAFVHITNYSFQKHSLNFQKFELGNEVPFYDFQKYLDKEFKDKKINVKEHIMEQVKYIVGLTMKSVREKINANNRSFCFEIFGYDFMMDIDFNVYLLEINTNPGLEISSPWIKAIVPRMVDDALRLTMDEVFPPKYQFDKNSITELNYEEYSNDLIHPKEEIKNEGPRKIKRKRFTTICDQGSGTQDVNDEQYQQENIRQREVKIQKKININNDENIKTNENNNNNKQPENEKDSIKEQKEKNNEENNNNISNNKNENKIKEKEQKEKEEKEKEKPFNQKDYKSPFPVPGYEPWDNLWEFICELKEEKPQNNYAPGIKGLLEIQKKRQTASAPLPNEANSNKKIVKPSSNNNITKEKNQINNNKNMNNLKEIKKEKKSENTKTNKKINENVNKKDKNTKTNNLNKKKEKEKEKKIKENNIKVINKMEEERKNNDIDKEKVNDKNNEIEKNSNKIEGSKIIQIDVKQEECKESIEKERKDILENEINDDKKQEQKV